MVFDNKSSATRFMKLLREYYLIIISCITFSAFRARTSIFILNCDASGGWITAHNKVTAVQKNVILIRFPFSTLIFEFEFDAIQIDFKCNFDPRSM